MRPARGYSEKATLSRLLTLVLKVCVQNQRQGMDKEELGLTKWRMENRTGRKSAPAFFLCLIVLFCF